MSDVQIVITFPVNYFPQALHPERPEFAFVIIDPEK
jgi:hypothetical protein